ncbi:MAG: 3-phosphoshikimate 1-carboxyvinyltransferase [Spirochaetes bacterium]|nr:3-phosphoshikimate 1-carboxyvinyltransferase [Spirochaetota bacterium]
MDVIIDGKRALRGTLQVPGDKSVSHRAVILGCLASGTSRIRGLSTAQDVGSTIRAFQRMGITIGTDAGEAVIHGTGIAGFDDAVPESLPEIDCENSGTSARLLIGLLSGAGKKVTLTGDDSLLRRPMMRVVEPLNDHGASIRATDGRLPVSLTGSRVAPIHYRVPVPSAQVKSSLMLAALFAEGRSAIVEPVLTRDHTERMLMHMDGPIAIKNAQRGNEIRITGRKELSPLELAIPGDISSAVFFIAAALVTPGSSVTIKNVLLNPTRAHILEVFRRMGARIETHVREEYPEVSGDIDVRYSKLSGVRIGGREIPLIIDEIPALAACALFARGETVVKGAEELRVKESDRIRSIVHMVRAFDGNIEEAEDGFTVHGRSGCGPAEVDTFGDHRIAMAASIIALAAKGRSIIRNAQCVHISYPDFFEVLENISG